MSDKQKQHRESLEVRLLDLVRDHNDRRGALRATIRLSLLPDDEKGEIFFPTWEGRSESITYRVTDIFGGSPDQLKELRRKTSTIPSWDRVYFLETLHYDYFVVESNRGGPSWELLDDDAPWAFFVTSDRKQVWFVRAVYGEDYDWWVVNAYDLHDNYGFKHYKGVIE